MRESQSNCVSSCPLRLPTDAKHIKTVDEEEILARWEDDIVRASQATAVRAGLGVNHPAVDDLAQEARLRLVLALRVHGIRLEAYLRRTVVNAVRTAATREFNGHPALVDVDELEAEQPLFASNQATLGSQEDLPDILARWAIMGWISTLPRQLVLVYVLLYVRELSQREAARALGVSQPRVAQLHRQLLTRGRANLHHLA